MGRELTDIAGVNHCLASDILDVLEDDVQRQHHALACARNPEEKSQLNQRFLMDKYAARVTFVHELFPYSFRGYPKASSRFLHCEAVCLGNLLVFLGIDEHQA